MTTSQIIRSTNTDDAAGVLRIDQTASPTVEQLRDWRIDFRSAAEPELRVTAAEVQLTALVTEIGRELEKRGIVRERDIDSFVEQAKEDAFRQTYDG